MPQSRSLQHQGIVQTFILPPHGCSTPEKTCKLDVSKEPIMLIAYPRIRAATMRGHTMCAPWALNGRVQPRLALSSSRTIQLRQSRRHGHCFEKIAREVNPSGAATARHDQFCDGLPKPCRAAAGTHSVRGTNWALGVKRSTGVRVRT